MTGICFGDTVLIRWPNPVMQLREGPPSNRLIVFLDSAVSYDLEDLKKLSVERIDVQVN